MVLRMGGCWMEVRVRLEECEMMYVDLLEFLEDTSVHLLRNENGESERHLPAATDGSRFSS